MNLVARHAAGNTLRFRAYATAAYVPPASLQTLQRTRGPPPKPRPESPTFYTGRSDYFDNLLALEEAVKLAHDALKRLHLLPLPRFAQKSARTPLVLWRSQKDLAELMGVSQTSFSTTRYRRLLEQLKELNRYRGIAVAADHTELADHIKKILEDYERPDTAAVLAARQKKPAKFDAYGRTYTVGRRKESAARVWMIPVQPTPGEEVFTPTPVPVAEAEPKTPTEPEQDPVSAFLEGSEAPSEPAENLEAPAMGIPGFQSGPLSMAPTPIKVPTTNILINNIPIEDYFPNVPNRERVIRPFRVTGLIGAYNVFALVRGGGTTGQTGALTLGIAKGLAAHAPDTEPLLRSARLLSRDPRMVERKKTGLAKARKAYAWVKR